MKTILITIAITALTLGVIVLILPLVTTWWAMIVAGVLAAILALALIDWTVKLTS